MKNPDDKFISQIEGDKKMLYISCETYANGSPVGIDAPENGSIEKPLATYAYAKDLVLTNAG